MKEKLTIVTDIKKMKKGRTDWKKVACMTEAQIERAAKSDPDALPSTKTQLKGFKRVHPPKEIDVQAIRHKLGFSQSDFASYFGISLRTLQEWEQHRSEPNPVARNFLSVVSQYPDVVQKALSHRNY
jgi:putative transcriptional regulator